MCIELGGGDARDAREWTRRCARGSVVLTPMAGSGRYSNLVVDVAPQSVRPLVHVGASGTTAAYIGRCLREP